MKKMLMLLLVCLPLALYAQTDSKYLEGAVPVVDGKVTFSIEMNVPAMNKEQIFNTLHEWAEQRYKPTQNLNARVLYSDPERGVIAIGGEEYIIFASTALALDKTRIYYHMIIRCETGKCDIDITRIRYWYEETRDGGQKFTAEEQITDEWALNKSKTKLAPIFGKFRRKTIDLKDELFHGIRSELGNKMIALGLQAAPVTPESQVIVSNEPKQTSPVTAQQPASRPVIIESPTPADNDTETLIKQSVRMTITAGNDEQFEIGKDCWGGFGELFGKKVAFCLIDTQKTMGNLLMSQSENYQISFYSAGRSKPDVVIFCKKLMQQTINSEEAQKMISEAESGKSYNMYVGEIMK